MTKTTQRKPIRFFILSLFFLVNANAQTVATFAGSEPGYADGTGTAAKFNSPYGLAVDAAGNVYIGDTHNNCIRKITPGGVVTTLAGSGTAGASDGTGSAAQFYNPCGLAVDAAGNVFVADEYNHRIRKITAAGVVTTLAGSTIGFAEGTGTGAKFNMPSDIAVDASGNVFVADQSNNRIRKITPGGTVSTLAGSTQGFTDGTGNAARFFYPFSLAVDTVGNVFVADSGNERIRKITPAGVVSTFVGATQGFGDGTGTEAQFHSPSGVAVDAAGNVYAADTVNQSIRKITPAGVVTTLAGSTIGFTDGIGTAVQFNHPFCVDIDADGSVFIADTYNNRIRKMTASLAIAGYQFENQISIYPNPAVSTITIALEDIDAAKAIIFDGNGREIRSANLMDTKSTINIADLANGVYFMQITSGNARTCKKIVKQ